VVAVPEAVGVGVGVTFVGVGDGLADAVGVGVGRCVGGGTTWCVVGGAVVAVLVPDVVVGVVVGLGRFVWCGAVGEGVDFPPVEGLSESLPSGRSAAIPAPITTTRMSPSNAIIGRDTDRRRRRGKPAVSESARIASGAVGGRW
jgi:hypothetical protein